MFCHSQPSSTRSLRPGFCHLSAPSKPFVDAYITHDLASELFYSKQSCILVLICLEKSVWWCCFYLHALAHERFTLGGRSSSQLQKKGDACMLSILFIQQAINGLAQFSHMTHVPCELGKKMHLCSYLRFLIVTLKTCQGESLLVCLLQFAFYVSVSLKWPQESDHHWGFSSLFFFPKKYRT